MKDYHPMNTFRHFTLPSPRSRRRGYRYASRPVSVLELLEDWLEEEAPFSNAERIQQMRRAYFADVDELEKSGTVIIPR